MVAKRKPSQAPSKAAAYELLTKLETWLRVSPGSAGSSYLASRSEIEAVCDGLRRSLEWDLARDHYLDLRTRYAAGIEAMRTAAKNGEHRRGQVDAFARAMGIVTGGGKRTSNLSIAERNAIVRKYVDLITVDGFVIADVEDALWASGWHKEGAEKPAAPQRESRPKLPERPVVKAPIRAVEAVHVLAEWCAWHFASPQAVRTFLVRERERLRSERAELAVSRKPHDLERLRRLPPCDYRVAGADSISRYRG
jgi:hypothetical protein